MIPGKRSILLTFGTALVLSALALSLTLLTPLGVTSALFLFIVAIILTTRFGGWGPGLLAALFATGRHRQLVRRRHRYENSGRDDPNLESGR